MKNIQNILKGVGVDYKTKRFSTAKEEVTKPIKKLTEKEKLNLELKKIAEKARNIEEIEKEVRLEEKNIIKKSVQNKLNKPFSLGRIIDTAPVRNQVVDEILPKQYISKTTLDYPEPFKEEPALNRELSEFKKKVNEHLRKMGFAGSGGGGSEKVADMQDVDSGSAKINGRFLKYEESSAKWVGDAGPHPDVIVLESGTDSSGNLVLDTAADVGNNFLFEDATSDLLLVLASHGITVSGQGWNALQFGD